MATRRMATFEDENAEFALPAPIDELRSRRDAMLADMRAAGVDVAVVTSPTSTFYLSGSYLGSFTFTGAVLVLAADGRHRVICRAIERSWSELWASQSWADDWLMYSDAESLSDVIASAIRLTHPKPLRALATELAGSASSAAARRAADALDVPQVVPVEALINPRRQIKSATELGHIRAAGRLTTVGTDAAKETIVAGGSDVDATAAAFTAMLTAGSQFPGLGPVVAAGPASTLAHVAFARRTPQPGDVVTSMMSGIVHGYGCPLERTFQFGDPQPMATAALEAIAQVVEEVIDSVRPGLTTREVNRIGVDKHAELGFSSEFSNRLGYTVGLNWAELDLPQLDGHDETVLCPGMTFHLVPGLLLPGVGLLCRSMPIVVTDEGCEPLIDYTLRPEPIEPSAGR